MTKTFKDSFNKPYDETIISKEECLKVIEDADWESIYRDAVDSVTGSIGVIRVKIDLTDGLIGQHHFTNANLGDIETHFIGCFSASSSDINNHGFDTIEFLTYEERQEWEALEEENPDLDTMDLWEWMEEKGIDDTERFGKVCADWWYNEEFNEFYNELVEHVETFYRDSIIEKIFEDTKDYVLDEDSNGYLHICENGYWEIRDLQFPGDTDESYYTINIQDITEVDTDDEQERRYYIETNLKMMIETALENLEVNRKLKEAGAI